MAKIKIKNFGPIKEGFKEILPDGTVNEWMDIKKVTVFIGNQGSGKSTVAKLISAFVWLEKAFVRGDFFNSENVKNYFDLLAFHRLDNYLQENTKLEYNGENYKFTLISTNNSAKPLVKVEKLENSDFKQPKIMYVPAERNFLSSITNINKVSDLIAGSLKDYAIEFRNAQLAFKDEQVDLKINNTKVFYDPRQDENFIFFNSKKLKLSEASSGFHSVVPLIWVTKYLIDYLQLGEKRLLEMLSTDHTIRRNKELSALNKEFISEVILKQKEHAINSRYLSKYFVNIVEEPEQNLFPTSQRSVLYSLLEYNNVNADNKLIMTTHSPYLLVYLTLAVEADRLKQRCKTDELKSKLIEVVPFASTIDGNELVIYQLDENTGTIEKLGNYRGLPSDENKLNDGLIDANDDFSKLLDLEDLCQ